MKFVDYQPLREVKMILTLVKLLCAVYGPTMPKRLIEVIANAFLSNEVIEDLALKTRLPRDYIAEGVGLKTGSTLSNFLAGELDTTPYTRLRVGIFLLEEWGKQNGLILRSETPKRSNPSPNCRCGQWEGPGLCNFCDLEARRNRYGVKTA